MQYGKQVFAKPWKVGRVHIFHISLTKKSKIYQTASSNTYMYLLFGNIRAISSMFIRVAMAIFPVGVFFNSKRKQIILFAVSFFVFQIWQG